MTTIGIRSVLAAVVAAVLPVLAGCAWQSGDDAVYYNQQTKHELAGEPSSGQAPGVEGGHGNFIVGGAVGTADPGVDTGGSGGGTDPTPPTCKDGNGRPCDPIPNPWDGSGNVGHTNK